jgi:hypothetical protein
MEGGAAAISATSQAVRSFIGLNTQKGEVITTSIFREVFTWNS